LDSAKQSKHYASRGLCDEETRHYASRIGVFPLEDKVFARARHVRVAMRCRGL